MSVEADDEQPEGLLRAESDATSGRPFEVLPEGKVTALKLQASKLLKIPADKAEEELIDIVAEVTGSGDLDAIPAGRETDILKKLQERAPKEATRGGAR